MQLHENSVRLYNASKVFVYKYINIKKQGFVKFLLFLHFIATGTFELLGILGTFNMAEHSYQSSPHSIPSSLSSFWHCSNFLIPGASIYVQSLLTFPIWGAQGRSKSPPRPVPPPPPSGITLNLSSFWENLTNTNNFTGRAASSEMKREFVIIKTTDCVSLLSIKLTEA